MEEPFPPEARPRHAKNSSDNREDIPRGLPRPSEAPAPPALLAAFFDLIHSCRSSRDFLEASAVFFARHSGCQAVGIRLAEGGGFPYCEARGFSAEFLASENDICARDPAGSPLRDARNKPVYQCLCGALAGGGCALAKHHLTPSGTFYANDLAGFLAGLSLRERKSHRVRNRCAASGYQSLALFPLGSKGECIGVLQMNDTRKSRFTPAFLAFWERLAREFSQALQRFQAEEALRARADELERKVAERTAQWEAANAAQRESEARFRQMAASIREVFWLADAQYPGRILYISPGCQEMLGYSARELCEHPKKWLSAVYLPDRRRVCKAFACFPADGAFEYHEYRIVRPDGTIRWICNQASPVLDAKGRAIRIVGVARDITEVKRMQEELLRISEREQQHIGQELHDGLCQHLAGTALVCKVLHNKLKAVGNPASRDMERICQLLSVAVDETRQLSHGLYPVRAGEGGLASALARLSKTISSFFPVRCIFRSGGSVNVFCEPAATHLFRIAQEAVNNAIKHGQAECVRISLRQKGGLVLLSIADNGVGIPEPLPSTCGIGLRIMAHRAAEFGGQLTVSRARRGGTVVVCSHPAEDEAPFPSASLGHAPPDQPAREERPPQRVRAQAECASNSY